MSVNSNETPRLSKLADGYFLFEGEKLTLNALSDRALLLHKNGNLQLAITIHTLILQEEPRHQSSLHAMGLIALNNNELENSLDFLNKALDVAPDNAVLYYDRALIFQKQGEHSAAVKNYDLALFLNKTYTVAYSNRGIALEALGEAPLALANYERAICLDPTFASAWYNRGNIYKSSSLFEQAIRCYVVATKLKPDFWEAFTNLGLSHYALKSFSKALIAYDQALLLQPDFAIIHYNRANVCRTIGDTQQALAGYDRAIELEPKFAAAFANRGLVRKDLNQFVAAKDDYFAALSFEPKLLEAQWNLSIVQLMLGNWTSGWDGYEMRFEHNELKDSVGVRSFNKPRWSRALPLNGKRILIYCEQGLGDAIQFSRYLPLLTQQGAYVILEAPPALKNLFQKLNGVSQLITSEDSVDEFDYFCPLLSLPREFQTTPETIPEPSEIRIEQALLSRWQKRINSADVSRKSSGLVSPNNANTKRIGLVWRGNPKHTNDHNRSLSLGELIKHLPEEFMYYVVQKEISDSDGLILSKYSNIINLSSELFDLTDTASLCLQMDLVICVDTSVAHLCATLNISTYLLLPFSPDWRWLLERADSPWYPNIKLFRQSAPADWSKPLLNIQKQLETSF